MGDAHRRVSFRGGARQKREHLGRADGWVLRQLVNAAGIDATVWVANAKERIRTT